MIERRSFLTAIGALIAAPAIVKVTSLMPVKVMPDPISLRDIVKYVPDQDISQFDILFGSVPIRSEWLSRMARRGTDLHVAMAHA